MPTMTDHQPQDIAPINAPKLCTECFEEEGVMRFEVSTQNTVILCNDCEESWKQFGAIFS